MKKDTAKRASANTMKAAKLILKIFMKLLVGVIDVIEISHQPAKAVNKYL